MDVQSETDTLSVLDAYAARQPDNGRLRVWEVTGTSHADAHLLGSEANYVQCGVPINNGPMYLVVQSAYHALTTWLETGKAPRHAPRIDVAPGASPQIVRNSEGIALGGIRTPPVDVPVEDLSGVPGANPSTICLLLGSGKPFSAVQLRHLYPSRAVYLRKYAADAQKTINAGFVLPQERALLMAFAEPSLIPR